MPSMRVKLVVVLFILISSVIAQETHNLEIIWQKTSPPNVWYLGSQLSSGDFNGDSFYDIVISGDSLHGDTWTHKAYIFFGGSQFDTIPDVVIVKGFIRLKGIGDINDDGFDDLALGSPNSPYGRVYIYLGGGPLDTICDFELKGPQDASAFGEAIGSGDVNGDSFSDLIVGAYGYDNLKGRVYIYFGGPSFDTIPDVILDGGHNNDQESFGFTVGSSGDVNNDGFDDIIIGARTFGSSTKGRVYVYFGGNPMNTIYDVAMTGEVPNQSLGWTPTVNLPKTEFEYDMAVFGSAFWPYGFPQEGPGKVYVLFGGNPMDSVPDIWMTGSGETTGLGRRVTDAGFVNQTNSEGIISGAPTDYNSLGTAYIWLGGALLDTTPDAWLRGILNGVGIGWYVASAGDVNGDSKDEIIVSNYAAIQTTKRVWVCKYTGPGIEERLTQNAGCLTLEVNPNPARSVVRVRCPLSVKGIKVYDIAGKIIKTLDVGKMLESRRYEIKWDLRDSNQKKVATGIYFIEIIANGELREIKKITIVK